MIYTNIDEYGGNFDIEVEHQFNSAKNVTIASGYLSIDVLEKYAGCFESVARNGGVARLLVGMAFYEGLSQSKLTRLTTLSQMLCRLNEASGVFVPFERKYHGKLYIFEKLESSSYYIGSSNFSSSGLRSNMEANVQINDSRTITDIDNYVDHLFSNNVSKHIDQLEIVVPGSAKYKQRISFSTLDELQRYNPSSISTEGLDYFELDLTRYTDKSKSSLNVYFGEGRLNRASGKITPRPWYEVALIAPANVIRSSAYPHGHFDAYTDDGYIIPMAANGDNDKNIQSRGHLTIFGMWLKRKLQKNGALIPLTPVTQDTLDAYGRKNIRFYKITDGKYYVDFSLSKHNDDEIVLVNTSENIE